MQLADLWLNSKHQIENKQVHQIIAFTGDGQLRDESAVSLEFREFLTLVPIDYLRKYTEQCLGNSFKDSGLVLQDLVNEMGRRLGFEVTNGRYHGSTKEIGNDGLWKLQSESEHSIIIEVKTTDAFRIDLNTIARYRTSLAERKYVNEANSSILIIVGREETGDLEAQIRGSRHAWDVRLISVDALVRLMTLKEQVEDQRVIQRIYDILIPREFTKLDEIVDILFSTAEEVKSVETDQLIEEDTLAESSTRAAFTDACIANVQHKLGMSLVKRARVFFSSPDSRVSVLCLVSKSYSRPGHTRYWFAFRPTQQDYLQRSEFGFVVLGCGSAERTLLVPFAEFQTWLAEMNISEIENRYYWHVEIYESEGKLVLHRKRGSKLIDMMQYLISEK